MISKKYKEEVFDDEPIMGFRQVIPRKTNDVTITLKNTRIKNRRAIENKIEELKEIVKDLHSTGEIEKISIKFY